MKHHYIIAALLGMFAFAATSFPAAAAQATGTQLAAAVDQHDFSGPPEDGANATDSGDSGDASDGEAAADDAAAADDGGGEATGPRSKMEQYDDAQEKCTASSEEIQGRNGGEATEKEIKEAYKTCMVTNGFNKYMIDKMEKEKEKEQ